MKDDWSDDSVCANLEYFHNFLPQERNSRRCPGFVVVVSKLTKHLGFPFFCKQRLDDIRNMAFFRRKPTTTTYETLLTEAQNGICKKKKIVIFYNRSFSTIFPVFSVRHNERKKEEKEKTNREGT